MDEEVKKECENCEQLRKQFKKQNAKHEKRISELESKVKQLTELLEKSQRAGKRLAAPFRKKKKKDPKKPGRKKGDDYGKQAFREAPSPNEVTERFEVPLPKKCPCCSGKEIEKTKTDRQYQYEIPTEPIIREFIIDVGVCQSCEQTIRGRHKLQTSNATGAARTQLGPKLHAMIAVLNKKLGLSHGKVQSLLSDFFGIKICRSQSYKLRVPKVLQAKIAVVELAQLRMQCDSKSRNFRRRDFWQTCL